MNYLLIEIMSLIFLSGNIYNIINLKPIINCVYCHSLEHIVSNSNSDMINQIKDPKLEKISSNEESEKSTSKENTRINDHIEIDLMCPKPDEATVQFRYNNVVNDEFFPKMWYLNDCRESKQDGPNKDINVIPVWNEFNIFGFGVKVIVVDSGVDINHEDLRDNYDKNYSWDFIDQDNVPEPSQDIFFDHGTSCAGIIAMRGNNKFCGIGISPFVTFGAIRINIGTVFSDSLLYQVFSFKVKDVDIMNNSWGNPDNAKIMVSLGRLTKLGLKIGINEGRRKKGVIYIFSSGNGKQNGDMCGTDSFLNSIFTIVVGGATSSGKITSYSEKCATVFVTAYSGDETSHSSYQIVTTTSTNSAKCTTSFYGTSASTAILSGAIALVLESNPNLTWREIQYILAWTSQVSPLQKNLGWHCNGAGFWVNHNFGFGLINVYDMVILAKSFQPVPPMVTCIVHPKLHSPLHISRTTSIMLKIDTNACENSPAEVNYIEHVQLVIDFYYTRRGNLEISLLSPLGTKANLLEPRGPDNFKGRVKNWMFDSIQTWGEPARGSWTLYISDNVDTPLFSEPKQGFVSDFTLVFYGTKYIPELYKKNRMYYKFSIPD